MKPLKLHNCVWGTGKKEKKKRGGGGWWRMEVCRESSMSPAGLPVLWDDGSGLCWEQGWGIGSWCVCCWMPYFILPHVHRGPPQTINWTTSACILAAEGHIILPHHGPRGGESSLPFPTGRADSLLLPISTMCFTIPSPKKFQLTAIHMNVHDPGAMFTETQQKSLRSSWPISDLTLWMGNRERRSAHGAASPFPWTERGARQERREKKSNFATSFFIMFPQSPQTSQMKRTT